ncbi:hypothetical protein MATL_G00252240 [Megalops atlanticus]|uniref:CARD domain-containing protein n=1 Tax=Megalops atlanticus TaxID=7932 RepID=A0A9D3SZM7_MEGAT|nr:hypothetical protein MATL_G00252240 [Megalops atlanticus]
MELVGKLVWSHTIVLFITQEKLGDTESKINQLSETRAVKQHKEKCGNRYYSFICKKWDSRQVKELLDKAQNIAAEYNGEYNCIRGEENEQLTQSTEIREMKKKMDEIIQEFLEVKEQAKESVSLKKQIAELKQKIEEIHSGNYTANKSTKDVCGDIASPTENASQQQEKTVYHISDPNATVSKQAISREVAAQFVEENRAELIQRVCVVDTIADALQSEKMIHEEVYNKICNAETSQEKMRKLFPGLNSVTAKAAFFNELLKHERLLLKDLGWKS